MNHVKDVMLEPNPKTVYGGPIPKMEGLSKCRDGRCSPSGCHLTNTDLMLDHKQATEHSKSPMFKKCYFEYLYMFDALSDRNWMQILAAYLSIPCPVNVP